MAHSHTLHWPGSAIMNSIFLYLVLINSAFIFAAEVADSNQVWKVKSALWWSFKTDLFYKREKYWLVCFDLCSLHRHRRKITQKSNSIRFAISPDEISPHLRMIMIMEPRRLEGMRRKIQRIMELIIGRNLHTNIKSSTKYFGLQEINSSMRLSMKKLKRKWRRTKKKTKEALHKAKKYSTRIHLTNLQTKMMKNKRKRNHDLTKHSAQIREGLNNKGTFCYTQDFL